MRELIYGHLTSFLSETINDVKDIFWTQSLTNIGHSPAGTWYSDAQTLLVCHQYGGVEPRLVEVGQSQLLPGHLHHHIVTAGEQPLGQLLHEHLGAHLERLVCGMGVSPVVSVPIGLSLHDTRSTHWSTFGTMILVNVHSLELIQPEEQISMTMILTMMTMTSVVPDTLSMHPVSADVTLDHEHSLFIDLATGTHSLSQTILSFTCLSVHDVLVLSRINLQ